jgi:D-glycerate 3-kinase
MRPGEAVAAILARDLGRALQASDKRPFVYGLCGAQGSGKSTAVALLAARLADTGLRVATLSLDDLYLPREDRLALAETIHPLFRTRGVPGTHDIPLGLATLNALARPGTVALPRFDKPHDTRADAASWPRIAAPVDVVLFEGWCVGALPEPAAALATPVNALERDGDGDGRWRHAVNAALAGAYRRLFDRIDRLALLAAPGFGVVAGWRREQEHAIRGTGAHVMDDAAIERFVAHYQRLTEHILAEMPMRADLVVRLNRERRVI